MITKTFPCPLKNEFFDLSGSLSCLMGIDFVCLHLGLLPVTENKLFLPNFSLLSCGPQIPSMIAFYFPTTCQLQVLPHTSNFCLPDQLTRWVYIWAEALTLQSIPLKFLGTIKDLVSVGSQRKRNTLKHQQ